MCVYVVCVFCACVRVCVMCMCMCVYYTVYIVCTQQKGCAHEHDAVRMQQCKEHPLLSPYLPQAEETWGTVSSAGNTPPNSWRVC